ncbi:MAG TPA: GNAT family protein [Myxococcales bacterium]|nr:GNAT family protein [Myxococcales bacterium]
MLALQRCLVRPWRPEDVESLAESADDLRIWRNLRDRFPHPYTRADAEAWIAANAGLEAPTNFAIEVNGKAVGGIGVTVQPDVYRHSAEIGYWLGVAHWRKGIATEAVGAVSEWAFRTLGIHRLYAGVFGWNPASARVLEKAGYQLEGRLRAAATKAGETVDVYLFARLADDLAAR